MFWKRDKASKQPPVRTRRFAHVSNVRMGRGPRSDKAAARMVAALADAGIELVIATGELTQSGRSSEWAAFQRAFAPLIDAGRLVVVPGESDRFGDGVASLIMPGAPVQATTHEGVAVVRLNAADEDLNADLVSRIDAALVAAPVGNLVVIAGFHSPLPSSAQPDRGERQHLFLVDGHRSTANPDTKTLARRTLLDLVAGRGDVLLHAFGDIPRAAGIANADRPLQIFSAGCSTEHGWVRVFSHDGQGHLLGAPLWMALPETPEQEAYDDPRPGLADWFARQHAASPASKGLQGPPVGRQLAG